MTFCIAEAEKIPCQRENFLSSSNFSVGDKYKIAGFTVQMGSRAGLCLGCLSEALETAPALVIEYFLQELSEPVSYVNDKVKSIYLLTDRKSRRKLQTLLYSLFHIYI